jgi:16S rRNA (guanine527-N7)-methyltransferase
MISNEVIIKCLEQYKVEADASQCDQIRRYVATLLRWNRKISLTSITDELEILKFHFGESVFALCAVGGINGRLADVGSGAGFPGLPLRIFDPSIDLTLIESNSKKCAFLSEVVRELGLAKVRVLRARFEDAREFDGILDAVASRAVGAFGDLLEWSAKALKSGGQVILWVGEDDARQISETPGWLWEHAVIVPGSERRYVLAGSPIVLTGD